METRINRMKTFKTGLHRPQCKLHVPARYMFTASGVPKRLIWAAVCNRIFLILSRIYSNSFFSLT
jgi:hypothetical protein